MLQLASTGPGLTFPDEADRLSIPVDGWNQALFDARNRPDLRLHRLRYPGNTLPQDPMSLDSPSRDGWTGSANVKLLQLVAAWRARSPAATPPVNQMDLSLVTDASLQTPPDDNLLMHTYQDRTSSRWDRQLHRERLTTEWPRASTHRQSKTLGRPLAATMKTTSLLVLATRAAVRTDRRSCGFTISARTTLGAAIGKSGYWWPCGSILPSQRTALARSSPCRGHPVTYPTTLTVTWT